VSKNTAKFAEKGENLFISKAERENKMKLSNFKLIAVLAASAALTVSALAQDLRLTVFRGNELYEVVTGSNTGGRFVRQNRKVGILTANGYTDRVAKGERVHAIVLGTGVARFGGWIKNGSWFDFRNNLPLSNYGVLNTVINVNSVTLGVQNQNSRWVYRTVPVGSRP
jgi:hypothetical protein